MTRLRARLEALTTRTRRTKGEPGAWERLEERLRRLIAYTEANPGDTAANERLARVLERITQMLSTKGEGAHEHLLRAQAHLERVVARLEASAKEKPS